VKKSARNAPDRMISGKLRPKASRAGADARLVAVDGTDYTWTYRHGWLVWGKGIKAVSVSVSLSPGRTRELILDFTLKVNAEEGIPSEERLVRALDGGIRSALLAGWNPESRGRAFRHEIHEAI
jgi:hypothetical protein